MSLPTCQSNPKNYLSERKQSRLWYLHSVTTDHKYQEIFCGMSSEKLKEIYFQHYFVISLGFLDLKKLFCFKWRFNGIIKKKYGPNIKMVFENIKIFEYYASVIALELGDNGIWYGSLCTFKYVPANVQVAELLFKQKHLPRI